MKTLVVNVGSGGTGPCNCGRCSVPRQSGQHNLKTALHDLDHALRELGQSVETLATNAPALGRTEPEYAVPTPYFEKGAH